MYTKNSNTKHIEYLSFLKKHIKDWIYIQIKTFFSQ